MANQNHSSLFNFFLLLSLLFVLIKCGYHSYTTDMDFLEFEGRGKETQQVDFPDSIKYSLKKYMKVTAKSKDKNPNPVMIIGKDSECKVDRRAIVKSLNDDPAAAYLTRDQVVTGEFYMCFQTKDDAVYDIRLEEFDEFLLEPNTVLSYLVSEQNQIMEFKVNRTREEESDVGASITIGYDGDSDALLNIYDQMGVQTVLDHGKIVNYQLNLKEDQNYLARFNITNVKVGNFITVNVHTSMNGKVKDNFLYPNGPTIMGVIFKDESSGTAEECFPMTLLGSEKYRTINKFFVTGRVFSKYAYFWLYDESGEWIVDSEVDVDDGQLSFVLESKGKVRELCFEVAYESDVNMDYAAYSISIVELSKLDKDNYEFNLPQNLGEPYRKIVPKSEFGYFHTIYDPKKTNYTFSAFVRKGAADAYIYDCDTYPNCNFMDSPYGSLKPLKSANRMYAYDIRSKFGSAIEPQKKIFVVFCKDDDDDNNGFCELDTYFYPEDSDIILTNNQKFFKYIDAGGKQGKFRLDFNAGVKLQTLLVDIMIFNGDVSFKIDYQNDETIDITCLEYDLANKVQYKCDLSGVSLDYITLTYNSHKSSFFSIQYRFDAGESILNYEKIISNENYLVTIDPTTKNKTKSVFINNYRKKFKQPFLINFFEINCEFEVSHIAKNPSNIEFSDGYAQLVATTTVSDYKNDSYQFDIKVKNADPSNVYDRMCMLYVQGHEIDDYIFQNEIVTTDNLNQQIIFGFEFKVVKFLYPQSDLSKDLAIYINVIDKARYNIKISIDNETEPIYDLNFTSSKTYYVGAADLRSVCTDGNLCNIIIQIEFVDVLWQILTAFPMIEVTMRQTQNSPSFLQKGIAKKDFTCGDNKYYIYTDIGKNDGGEITINFLRDFGTVYARIVRKDQTNKDTGANWRGKYVFPDDNCGYELLPYNYYSKKVDIPVEKTYDCATGCYLLLTIQISQIGEYVSDYKFYPFSIITKIIASSQSQKDIPKIVIQVDEYIVGNVDVTTPDKITQFYEIWFSHDSPAVYFDWQSEVAGLYINVGGERPSTKNADFIKLPPGRHESLSITKYDILEICDKKKIPHIEDKLEEVNLVIGIWTDKTNALNTELFSLRVYQSAIEEDLDIIKVDTDQKILCTPRYIESDKYRCLFMILYDIQDVYLEMPLLVHADSANIAANTEIYARFIDSEYYDAYETEELRSSIPTQDSADYKTTDTGYNYINTTLDFNRKDKYLYVSVISNTDDTIMLLSSLPTFNAIKKDEFDFYPNPHSETIVYSDIEKLTLRFFGDSSIFVNIVTLKGEAELNWLKDDTIYYLRGRGDRVSLSSGRKIRDLVIKRKKTQEINEYYFFYVSFVTRREDYNFDQIKYGKSLEVGYKETDLPLYLYSKIGEIRQDLHVAITFKDLVLDPNGTYIESPIQIRSAITKESTVYKAKSDPGLAPDLEHSTYGRYDFDLKTGEVFIPKDLIEFFNVSIEDNPTLYVAIEKNPLYKDRIYTDFTVESQINIMNDMIIPVEKTYHYGKFYPSYSEIEPRQTNVYRLKYEDKCEYMVVVVAINFKYIDFIINNTTDATKNTSLIKEAKDKNGRVVIYIEKPKQDLYIKFYYNGKIEEIIDLNYAFKYINVKKKDEFKDYEIKGEGDLDCSEVTKGNNATITCKFKRIDVQPGDANITYFLKVVDNETLRYGEELVTIALMDSPYIASYIRNPAYDGNDMITLSITSDKKMLNWAYLQVIAQIQQQTILEYVSYKGKKEIRPPPIQPTDKTDKKSGDEDDDDDGGSSITVYVVVGVLLLLLIGGLIVVLVYFEKRNKSLLTQVKHVSFQQKAQNNPTGGAADPNLLLQKSGKKEVDENPSEENNQ